MWHQHSSTLLWAMLAILITLLARFLANLYYWRRLCHDKPGPPHHFLWGHLAVMGELLRSQPSRATPQSLVVSLQRHYNLPDVFYMDPWPFGPSILVATHPAISNQFTVKPSMPKHPVVAEFTEKFGGRSNMVAADGPEWKTWRSAFNPGFSAAHLMTLMPVIVDDVQVFCEILEQRAAEDRPFRLEHLATRLTIDIIGKIVLDTRFDSQTGENELVSAFERQVRWMPVAGGGRINLLDLFNPLRPFILRYNSYIMKRYVSRELENRFAARDQLGKKKHVIDLAMETYLNETNTKDPGMSKKLDKTFKTQAIANIEIFLFAGHDTSSSAICYALYHLGRDKKALAIARNEIVELFGPDPSKIGLKIKDHPWLLNKMDYGLAVIREVLRLYPPASSVRIGSKDCFVIDPETNQKYPTENFMLWASTIGIHRNPKIWGDDADEFKPERWLDSAPNRAAHHEANTAFSKGQRNCIGQELALLELRMVLAMTVTKFEFTAAFDELDQLRNDKSGYPSDTSGIQEQFGEQAYQIQLGTAKPREGLPCRVRLVV